MASTTGSLDWLWQTVGATCCWALSDIVCDICIGSAEAAPVAVPMGKLEENEATAAREGCLEVEKVEIEASAVLKKRQRRGITQPHPQPRLNTLSVERRTGVRGKCERKCEASPDICLSRGECVEASPDTGVSRGECVEASVKLTPKLTPEQNALLSGVIALLTVACVIVLVGFMELASWAGVGNALPGTTLRWSDLLRVDEVSKLAALGGCFHFTAYLSTLCAFGFASSTVITPLMQLSAVWMLPFSTVAAFFGNASVIRPIHLLSVVLICTGGFLPAAQGSLSTLLTKEFWHQRAIRYVAMGEFLICCYNLILHQATFDKEAAPQDGGAFISDTFRFFLISRTFNGLTSLCLFANVPWLRSHAVALRRVCPRTLCGASIGECLSMLGVCLVTFSYSSFYEPSVVNAVEGGLQQLLNLLFAILSYSVLGLGKKVDYIGVKFVSFVLVMSGLALSTV